MADRVLGAFFRKAEKDLQEVARKHGFNLRLVDSTQGTWYFFPEVMEDNWEPVKHDTPENDMQQELMAFWPHDVFPFVLWGEVEEFTDEGLVKTKSYGTMLFKPLYVVPKDTGMLLIKDIDKLKGSYADSLARVKSDHKKKLNDLLPFKWR